MMICSICGHVIAEEDLPTYRQVHGYTDLRAITEDVVDYRCHECGRGEYETAIECQLCGCYFHSEDGIDVCECCLEEEETLENAVKIGAENTEDVEVNGFFVKLFGARRINEILERAAELADRASIAEYLYEDKRYFAGHVLEGVM